MRTEDWKYVHYYKEPFYDELYDLKNDPYEMHNVVGESELRTVLNDLDLQLDELLKD